LIKPYLDSLKPAYPLESFILTGKTCESTLHTQGFRTHVVVGDETADFCCFCTKVVLKDVVPKDEPQQ
jgi:very-short-patch-repair endonuclease